MKLITMKTKIYNMKKTALIMIFSLIHFCSVFAQVENSKLKDGTVSSGPREAFPGALLELESNNKGMLTPRLTTGERDNMTDKTDGLILFNTTTGCFDYWTAAQNIWLSICGTPPPAEIKIDCDNTKTNGTYKQGVALSSSEFLTLPVTVTQIGTYTISATTPNGYYYNVNGTFPNTGTYTLLIPGIGTPGTGYDAGDPGDVLTININGKEDTTCHPTNFVEKSIIQFSFVCDEIIPAGDYFIDSHLNQTHTLDVKVFVNTTGYWTMSTEVQNGFSYRGSGVFQPGDVGQIITVSLLGSGTPTDSGNTIFKVTSNATPAAECLGVIVAVKPVAYTMICPAASHQGNFMQDVVLTSENKISLPIDVTATGQTTITTNTVNGMTFSSGPINLTAFGQQTVTLVGTGTPSAGQISVFAATGTGKTASGTYEIIATCNDLTVNVAAQPVDYTIDCAGITTTGTFSPGATMDATNTMVLPVDVKYVGAYNIITNVENGVSFSGSGTFTATGTQNVVLTASSTVATTGGPFTYNLTANSTNNCSKIIYYAYRTMNVLGLGQGVYQPATAGTGNSARAIITNKTSFGPTGKIKVEDIKIIDGGFSTGDALRNLINTNKIDIIVIGFNYTQTSDARTRAVLTDFVINKRGVLLHSQENDATATQLLITDICGGTPVVSNTGSTLTNPILNVSDPILEGPFMDIKGRALGNDVNNSYYVSNFPPSVTLLATQTGNASKAWAFKHNALGYLFVGDSGWLAGDSSNTSTDIWPTKMSSTGLPLAKPFNAGVTVYNSFMYANAMAWAIGFVQNNMVAGYNIP